MGEIFAATFFTAGTFNIDTQSDGGTTCEISFYTLKAASFNSCYIWSSTDCFILNDSSATLKDFYHSFFNILNEKNGLIFL